jgi:hypothetical protein
MEVLNDLNGKKYDKIREMDKFQTIINKYKPFAKNKDMRL